MEILNCDLVQKPFWRLAAVIVTNVDPIQLAKVRTFYREVIFSTKRNEKRNSLTLIACEFTLHICRFLDNLMSMLELCVQKAAKVCRRDESC